MNKEPQSGRGKVGWGGWHRGKSPNGMVRERDQRKVLKKNVKKKVW